MYQVYSISTLSIACKQMTASDSESNHKLNIFCSTNFPYALVYLNGISLAVCLLGNLGICAHFFKLFVSICNFHY